MATFTSVPDTDSQCSHRLLAQHLHAGGVGISASQIGRILHDLDLKPHRVRGWLNRPEDPDEVASGDTVPKGVERRGRA